MDRFQWCDSAKLLPGEVISLSKDQIKLYDGDDESNFQPGLLQLTSHRLLFHDSGGSLLALSLALLRDHKETGGGLTRSPKIELYLLPRPQGQPLGPIARSRYDMVKLSFRKGGCTEFCSALKTELSNKNWERVTAGPARGISGIERKLEQKRQDAGRDINVAFKDLKALMDKAQEMVSLINTFATRMEQSKGSVVEDETIKLKSVLLSVGIDNPVTKSSHGSTTVYHQELARELSKFLVKLLPGENGIITLADLYCRFNRARGLELVSPDDVFNACTLFERMGLPVRLKKFESGVLCVLGASHSESEVVKRVGDLVMKHKCLSVQELSAYLHISVLLAQEHMLLAERVGALCRDDSVDGLKFYTNRF
ncbi:hypothetical protein LOD99_7567 [Oopsacas minuta]|uniref:Vacuolar protein-sorting-associated protein 36 n=1 Tax=Oopsacas minuta TaxID=111878 RepID=A0AAV7JQB5_9METZ|nr:hypothetical protein LOD99_7567 [Oopsacas minuta]